MPPLLLQWIAQPQNEFYFLWHSWPNGFERFILTAANYDQTEKSDRDWPRRSLLVGNLYNERIARMGHCLVVLATYKPFYVKTSLFFQLSFKTIFSENGALVKCTALWMYGPHLQDGSGPKFHRCIHWKHPSLIRLLFIFIRKVTGWLTSRIFTEMDKEQWLC